VNDCLIEIPMEITPKTSLKSLTFEVTIGKLLSLFPHGHCISGVAPQIWVHGRDPFS
jgi:hypothetical protein